MAATSDFSFRHYTVDNGLPSNAVRAVIQDGFGFIWFGTDEGLCRYDGVRIRQFSFNPAGSDHYVSCLMDEGSRLWVGTYYGVYLFNYVTEKFTKLSVKTNRGIAINSNIKNITRDKDGNVWIATTQQGVFRYSQTTNHLDQYSFKSLNGKVANIMADSENQVWVVTNWATPAVWLLDKARNIFRPLNIIGATNEDCMSLVMREDSEGNRWLGTWEHGLMRIDVTGRVETYLKNVMHIHAITEYAPHLLLIGCDDGLILFNTLSRAEQRFTEDDSNPLALSNRFVYPIFKDIEGGIWVGTFYGGVNYIAPNAGRFVSYSCSKTHNSVGGNVINRFCEDSKGNVWIASDDGGLSCLSPTTGKFTNYMPQKGGNSLSYHNVHALYVDGDNLWIGTYTGGINVLNLSTGHFKYYNFKQKSVPTPDGSSCYSIFKDNQGQLWAASMDGIYKYVKESDDFVKMKPVGAITIDIDQDIDGNMWFSTQGTGLYMYNEKTRKWKHYKHSASRYSLPNDQVNCVNIDSNGQMWVATMNGLCRYDKRTDGFVRVDLQIPNQDIACIIEDNHSLWLTTSHGLLRYTPGEPCQLFTRSDGLHSDLFLPNAGLKTSDGRIFIGSVNGFNAFYPYQVHTNHIVPKIYITGLYIFNKHVEVGSKKLPQSLNSIKELNLAYSDNMFSLSFASLSFCTPEKNRYSYKLEGFDKQWNNVGQQTTATYTNLSPGTYVFRVRATNNDGVWSSKDATLKIIIHPPFYWSLPSKIFYLLLLSFAIYMVVRYLLKRSEKRHNEEMRQLNENKEIELRNAKINFFTMIAHEIRTPVTLIIGPLENVLKSASTFPKSISDDLNVVDRNAHRLLYLVNQLLDFRKVERKTYVMRFAVQNIRHIMEAITERFGPMFQHNGVDFSVVYPDETFTAIVDSEAITKVISNLLTNAAKYTKDKVELSCRVDDDGEHFVLSVSDNGMGIKKEDQQRIFQPFVQASDNKPGTGIGLSIVKNIVDLHKGQLSVVSEVGQGSTFSISLPVKQEGVSIGEAEEKDVPTMEKTSLESGQCLKTDDRDTMLVVDDNEDMVNFISANFRNKYNVITAVDGVEALEKLRQNYVSMIVSDWMMPRMNGMELCKAVRADANTSHIPFIMLTAKTDNDSKVQGMDQGADAYIEKPFSMQYLEACIKNLIDMRRLLREKFSHQPLEPLSHIASNPVDNDFLVKMNKIIEDNFSNPDLSVAFLADRLCISRSGLFAKIKMLADITPNEMIQMVRLKKAASLLANGKYHINEVCYMVGFSNPSYFSKCFQKQFGVKPNDFAQHN
jgi:signal transduction histidine kinase/ligand-binding sensor domain-containing protein/CheY-like chemotaxis protein